MLYDKLSADITRYLAGYLTCDKTMADWHERQTKLVPIPKNEHYLKEIVIHVSIELLQAELFNVTFVVTDQFTNILYYLSSKTALTAADLADAYFKKIWRFHSLSRYITCNCGLQFASTFLKELKSKLNINLYLSTALPSPTDVLGKQVVMTLKEYLCIYSQDT